jgi:RNA polymerase sigma factor (sigma-70 family)
MTTLDDPASHISALFDAHCGFVCRVLRHHGVHEAALDDAVQDVFVTAYRRWASFEGRSSARSWLYGIARRIASRYRRSADARARRFVPAADAPAEGVDEPFARAHAAQSLAALLHELDADKRTVFVLTELEGMTAPEVAEALGIPLGTAYSRLRAAWQVLGRQAGREEQRLRRALPSMREPEPSPERRRHMWSLVVGGLRLPAEAGSGTAVTATATGWLGQIKWLAVGAALGVGLLGARAAVVASSHRGDDEASSPSGATLRAKTASSKEQAAAAVQAEAASPPTSSRSIAPIEPAMPSTAVEAPPASPGATRASPSTRTAIAPTDPAEPSDDGALAAELALLRQAREAVRDGRADDALALLDRHAREYPRGQLADERRALEGELARTGSSPPPSASATLPR